MNDIILLITEGLKPEYGIIDKCKNIFFSSSNRNVVKACWGTDLISLCKMIQEDKFLDYLAVLKKTN